MTRKEAIETEAMLGRLQSLNITRADAEALRRISMTLHRWHELECGDANGNAVERDGDEPGSKPYMTYERASGSRGRYPIADRETGARKRLAPIMARYPSLSAYVQGDPRGCALYILRPGDVPEGGDVGSYYSRGIAVFK